jgi:tripeptidyl-peptidase-1
MTFTHVLTFILIALISAVHAHKAGPWKSLLDINDDRRNAKITFTVALHQNQKGVKHLEWYILNHLSNSDSPNYGKYLSVNHINKLVSPPIEDKNLVKRWLSYGGVNSDTCDDFGDSFRCTGAIEQVNRLLRVVLLPHFNTETGEIRYLSTTPYKIPEELEGIIEFVDGISNPLFANTYKKVNVKGTSDVDLGSVSREVLMRMYNVYPTFVGSNVSVGAIEYEGTDGFSNKDLLSSQEMNGVPPNPITKDHIIGTEESPDTESELDVQVMYYAASDATLWYDVAKDWMYTWANSFANRKVVPEVVSLSWGWSEKQQCAIATCTNETTKQYVQRSNVEFAKIVARGTTIVVASGDAGSPGRVNEACQSQQDEYGWTNLNAVFPGGSPWVTSVGATYVVASDAKFDYKTPICNNPNVTGVTCANGLEERGVSFDKVQWTTGAGFTLWDETPTWQYPEVQKYLQSGVELPDFKFFNRNGRAYPDVSAFGHNCVIKLSYMGWQNVDGTSCSSPIFAGVIANLNAFQKSRGKPILGFANPLLYRMHRESPETFNDITVGKTSCTEDICCHPSKQYGFTATEGWDSASGLGSPNVEKMKEYLSNMKN